MRGVVPFASFAQWEVCRAQQPRGREGRRHGAQPRRRRRREAGGLAHLRPSSANTTPSKEHWRAPKRRWPKRPPVETGRRKLTYGEQREYDAIEETLARAEAALAEAAAESEKPEHASDAGRLVELIAAVTARQEDIDRLYARWAELEAKVGGK